MQTAGFRLYSVHCSVTGQCPESLRIITVAVSSEDARSEDTRTGM